MEKNQSIILEADSNSFLFNTAQTSEIIFKIIPDYTSRILQLKKGDIDLVELIKVEDIEDFKSLSNLSIFNNVGREYDYIGWNNIDPEEFSSGKVKPNKLFGNKNVRRALTIAINRKEILSEYLLNKGTLASTPVSPIFKSFFDENLKPYEYNPDEAKTILAEEGWKDEDKNGILENGKTEFRFTLYYPVGNPLREFASVVVKNNLKAIGIEVTLEKMEMGTFIDYLYERKLDSWMAGWGIPIPLELKPYWYSDPNIGVLNFACYGSSETDSVLNQLDSKIINEHKIILIKNFRQSFIRMNRFLFFIGHLILSFITIG
ncbi:MAG: ABC transporter substrate-binding protein [Ignavibacteriaceae bacterium]|nr:ABC transporter substrate-binding protein [Ignavibacteriaceae bacterium]